MKKAVQTICLFFFSLCSYSQGIGDSAILNGQKWMFGISGGYNKSHTTYDPPGSSSVEMLDENPGLNCR